MPNENATPADLAEIIAIHKALFAGFSMMADEAPAAEPQTAATTDPAPANPAPAEKAEEPLKEPGLKALQSEREARQKAEADLAALRKQVEDANKTAEQKAADDLKAAQKAAEDSAARALRYEVAADKGLDLKLAARLAGSTKEELEADADALKALVGAAKPAAPRPDPSAGHNGDPKPRSLTEAISDHYNT